jgi:hypothetical protein
MSPLAQAIYDKVIELNGSVSFVELMKLDGFKEPDESKSGRVIEMRPNLVLWQGLSSEAVAAINELKEAKKVFATPASQLTYMVDGTMLKMPIAKNLREYVHPHWYPVCFNTPDQLVEQGQATREQMDEWLATGKC